MKKLFFIFTLLSMVLIACGQDDKTFVTPPKFPNGFYLGTTLWPPTTVPGGGTGSTFDGYYSSLKGIPATFAPSAHDHNLLYKPLSWKADWSTDVTGKPTTFLPAAHTHAWATDITGKPAEVELVNEIPKMAWVEPHPYTTAQINALVVPPGKMVIVTDITLGVLKFWNGTTWKTLITGQ